MANTHFANLAPTLNFKESSESLPINSSLRLDITHQNIEALLNDERPFLYLADGTIDCVDIILCDGLPPCIKLLIMGKVVMIKGYKERITKKIVNNFMIPGLRVEYEKGDYDIFADQICK